MPFSDRHYRAFQANGALWQWKRISFGLINVVPCFQRSIDDIIKENDCEETFAYLNNITVCGRNQTERDRNLKKFLEVAKTHNLTFNDSKRVYSTDTIDLLDYRIYNGSLKPDPNRVKIFFDLPCPQTFKRTTTCRRLFRILCTMDCQVF